MTNRVLNFDNNATMSLAPEVRAGLVTFLAEDDHGNPSSPHRRGHRAAQILTDARRQVADFCGARPSQVTFYSSATEALNTVIRAFDGKRIVVGATEHPAVLEPASRLRVAATTCGVTPMGALDHSAFSTLVRGCDLSVVMRANNETGVLTDTAALRPHLGETLLLVDAVQSAPWEAPSLEAYGAHFMVVSGHKLGGPVGAAALISHSAMTIEPLILGGQQERGARGGTENLFAIRGLGLACSVVRDPNRIRLLRDRLEQRLVTDHAAIVHGVGEPRTPNVINCRFDPIDADALLIELDSRGVCASSGSACATGKRDPSHVLLAMGLSAQQAWSTIRLSLGPDTTAEQVDELLIRFAAAMEAVRNAA
jgi:cysteine desulfurase